MSSAPRTVISPGSPGPAPIMYTRIVTSSPPSGTLQDRFANDIPNGRWHLAQPRTGDSSSARLLDLLFAEDQGPEPLAHGTIATHGQPFADDLSCLHALDCNRQGRSRQRRSTRRDQLSVAVAHHVTLRRHVKTCRLPVTRDLGVADQIPNSSAI